MDKETNQDFSSAWNSASAVMFEIAKLRTAANSFYVAGKHQLAINNLIAIQQTITSILNKGEYEELEKIEDEFFDTILIIESGEDTFDSKEQEWLVAKKNLLKIYNKYNRCIMLALQNHDLLLSEKTDTTKMQE